MFVISASCFITLYFLLYLLSPYSINKSSYVAASLDKEHSLSIIRPPRLIFVGGSNLALGLNSPKISAKIGYPVINMGLHAGLGLEFALNEAKTGIKPGDIIILSIEHFLAEGNKKLLAQLIEVNPKAASIINLQPLDKVRIIISRLQLCLSGSYYKLIKRNKDPIFYREAFNANGDLMSHYGRPKPSVTGGNIKFPNTNYSTGINLINEFIEFATNKGAVVYFTFPAFQDSAFKANNQILNKLASQYKASLKCPILGNIRSFVLQDKYFFDTVYHLDSTGIQKRTDIMINLLEKVKEISAHKKTSSTKSK